MAWTQQATDDFLRANESPLAGNWGAYAGNAGNRFDLTSNQASPAAHLNTDMMAGWNARTWAQDQSSKVQVRVSSTSVGTGPGPLVRFLEGAHTSGYYGYRLVINKAASANAQLDRCSNGTWTNDIAHWTVGHVDGDTYELRVEGLGAATHLTVLRNDVEVGTYDDASGLSSIGIPGIAYSSTTTLAICDDFIGSELVGQIVLPDADLAADGWTTSPLYSKVNDSSDATVMTATAS